MSRLIDANPWTDSMSEEQAWFAQLRWYGETRHLKPGWAAYTFKERFGHWPPRELESTRQLPPDGEVLVYIAKRKRAYVKAKRKSEQAADGKTRVVVDRTTRRDPAREDRGERLGRNRHWTEARDD